MTLQRLASAALLALAAASSHAATYSFGSLLSGDGPLNANFGTLEVVANGADITFTLSVPGLDALGSNAFLGALAVDGLQQGSVADVTGGSPVSVSNAGGPGGSFDFRFDLTGPKQARLTDNESVSWTWKNANQTVESLKFAAHVQGLPGGKSAWYSPAPAVPEPQSLALVLAGLGAVGLMARKRGAV